MEVGKVDMILGMFVRDSGGELDPLALSDLRVAIRISMDFYGFLVKWEDQFPQTEVEYVLNTIRSGIDSFFSVAFMARVLDQTNLSGAEWEKGGDLSGLRRNYLARFDALSNPILHFEERLGVLLNLCQSQLLFLAENFKVIIDISGPAKSE